MRLGSCSWQNTERFHTSKCQALQSLFRLGCLWAYPTASHRAMNCRNVRGPNLRNLAGNQNRAYVNSKRMNDLKYFCQFLWQLLSTKCVFLLSREFFLPSISLFVSRFPTSLHTSEEVSTKMVLLRFFSNTM